MKDSEKDYAFWRAFSGSTDNKIYLTCSECEGLEGVYKGQAIPPYCKWCGAKMGELLKEKNDVG